MLTIVNMPFLVFSNANARCFQVYILVSSDGHARLINLTAQSIDRTARSIDCMVNIQGMLPTQD